MGDLFHQATSALYDPGGPTRRLEQKRQEMTPASLQRNRQGPEEIDDVTSPRAIPVHEPLRYRGRGDVKLAVAVTPASWTWLMARPVTLWVAFKQGLAAKGPCSQASHVGTA